MKLSPKILVIDENAEILKFLIDFGYDVTFITSNKGALSYLKSTNDKFDLIILDVMISFVAGWEVLKYLRSVKNFEYTPVIVVTSLQEKTDELLALRSGADDFIREPFDIDLLLARIDAALRRSMWNKFAFVNLNELSFIEFSESIQCLTNRETTVLQMLSKGFSNDEIANELILSKLTVKTHIKNIFKKLRVSNRTEAILVGLKLELIKG